MRESLVCAGDRVGRKKRRNNIILKIVFIVIDDYSIEAA
jgi:hypothetical protein